MMKKAFLTCLVVGLALSMTMQAQIKTPAPSPSNTYEQMVGLTKVTIEYSRPHMKEREIFGGLVPYDEAWRLGANSATKFTFSEDVVIGGKDLKAGSYAVLAKPGKESWSIMLYPHTTGNFGAYLESDVEPTTVMAEVGQMADATIQNFMILVDDVKSDGAVILFGWDKTMAALPLKVHTSKAVQANIDQVMAGPSANDYFAAASYYHSEGKDLDKALEWMNKSIEMGYDRFWVQRAKSLIQAKLGDKAGAIESAKKSLEMATEAKNNDYIKMNEASIKEWMM